MNATFRTMVIALGLIRALSAHGEKPPPKAVSETPEQRIVSLSSKNGLKSTADLLALTERHLLTFDNLALRGSSLPTEWNARNRSLSMELDLLKDKQSTKAVDLRETYERLTTAIRREVTQFESDLSTVVDLRGKLETALKDLYGEDLFRERAVFRRSANLLAESEANLRSLEEQERTWMRIRQEANLGAEGRADAVLEEVRTQLALARDRTKRLRDAVDGLGDKPEVFRKEVDHVEEVYDALLKREAQLKAALNENPIEVDVDAKGGINGGLKGLLAYLRDTYGILESVD